MQEVEKYRQYAADCMRLAGRASNESDKHALMKIADAWEQQAKMAEADRSKRDGLA
jgi:hypothetical protein